MEYSLQKLEKSRVELAVSVEKEEWKNFFQKAYQKTKHQFAVEGFRKGKVPYSILVKRYGVEIFMEDAMELAIDEYYQQIIEKDKLNVVSRPDVNVTSVDEDAFKFTLTVAVYPEFELGAYKGLKIAKAERKAVADEDVRRVIDSDLDAAARFVDVTDRAVQDGDMVSIDYCGSVDGVEFEGGNTQGQGTDLVIGSGSYIGTMAGVLVIVMLEGVMSALGLPVGIAGLLIAIEPLIDMGRTALNVSDGMVSALGTARFTGNFNKTVYDDPKAEFVDKAARH